MLYCANVFARPHSNPSGSRAYFVCIAGVGGWYEYWIGGALFVCVVFVFLYRFFYQFVVVVAFFLLCCALCWTANFACLCTNFVCVVVVWG